MKIFAKEPKLAKLLRELKSTPVRYYKKSTDFLVCLCVTAFFCVLGALLRDNMLMDAFLLMHCNIYN